MNISVEIPEGVSVSIESGIVKMQGPKGSLERKLVNPRLALSVIDGHVEISAKNATKKEKMNIGTFKAHLNNMIKGVTEGHSYKLKICSSHFPMTVKAENNTVSIKNYLGEVHPRIVKIVQGANVKIEGDIITVESADIEVAGQTAGSIEKATRITNRDRRIFQDGIFIVEKKGKQL